MTDPSIPSTRHVSYTNGDLLRAEERVLVHGCNDKGVMGSGVAKAVRERWPKTFHPYSYAHASGIMSLGQSIWAPINSDETRWIVHLITQHGYGGDGRRYVSYDAVDRGLRELIERARIESLETTLAMPKIGSGLGGGDWRIISAILERVGEDTGFSFNVYVPNEAEYAQHVGSLDRLIENEKNHSNSSNL